MVWSSDYRNWSPAAFMPAPAAAIRGCIPFISCAAGALVELSFRAGRRKAPKARAFGCRRRNHRWAGAGGGRRQSHSATAFALDPCRGWGRYPSACIRTQKEPFVPPVGTGAEYRSTREVSSRLATPFRTRRQGISRGERKHANRDPRCGLATSLPSRHRRSAGNAHTLQKDVVCWVARLGEVCASTGVDTSGAGCADLLRSLPRLAWRPAFRAGLLAVDGKSAFAIGILAAGPERAGLASTLTGGAAAQRARRALRQLDGQCGAAVLLHELGDPDRLLVDECLQRQTAGFNHVQRLFPYRRRAGVGDGMRATRGMGNELPAWEVDGSRSVNKPHPMSAGFVGRKAIATIPGG